MKISYNLLKKYIPELENPEQVAQLLTMHTAEVEEIIEQWSHLKTVFIVEILDVKKHPEADTLNLCKIVHNNEELQIVCGAPNVKAWLIVPLATIWTDLWEGFIIKKSKIRGETSEWMLCWADEIGLTHEKQDGIMELPSNAQLWKSMFEYVWTHDSIIEVDNKAINHRPDLFSHVWIIRELTTILWKKLDFEYALNIFSNTSEDLWIQVEIPELVRRYIWVSMSWAQNIQSPDYIKELLNTEWIDSKGILVDITNYSLYFYGQPTHCFDADTLEWNIVVRKAKAWETLLALNDKEYKLTEDDIVIADQKKVIALWGIIGGKDTAVSNTTKNIVIEAAHFDQATVRQTWKRHGLRTDALNVFEKDLQPEMAEKWMNLIISELQKNMSHTQINWYSDIYTSKQKSVTVDFNLDFINNLIGKEYNKNECLEVLENLWIKETWGKLEIPFWRKDIHYKADIAEEITRINGFDAVPPTNIRINTWAVLQNTNYRLKRDSRNFWVQHGFYDMYNYSFVWSEIMQKLWENTKELVALKNSLSEDATHMKNSHIPNLLKTLEQNIKQFKNLSLFEIEKVYHAKNENIWETTMLSWLMTSSKDIPYYDIQKLVSEYLLSIGITKYSFELGNTSPDYVHSGRTANLVIRGQSVWIVWEIHPLVAKNFKIKDKIAFFDINLEALENAAYSITKAKEISEFQENSFDINFAINKDAKGSQIQQTIEKTDPKHIKKVELFDIYEDEEKLPWQRSISFKVFTQSLEGTLNDEYKNNLIKEIVSKVEKKWGTLR
jgi:phenylalanyl-tRNA synthetase beta chain